jgi:methyl-accepting chemotaxis protein
VSKVSNLMRRGVRYRYRLVAAMLVVSVPLMIGLAWLLTSAATSSLTSAAQDRGGNVARAVTLHLEDWVSERREQVSLVATEASGRLDDPAVARLLTGVQAAAEDYVVVQILDLRGNVVATSRPGFSLATSNQGWFSAASSGKPALTSMVARGDRIQWVMAEPILGPDGRPDGVVAADLNSAVLADLLNPELDKGTEVVAVDAQQKLLYDTAMGPVATPKALLAAGSLGSTIDNAATRAATETGDFGAIRFTDAHGHDVIGGYDVVDDLGWTIVAQAAATTVLAPVAHQRNRAILIVALGTVLAIAVSMGLAARTTRPIRRLTEAARQAAGGDLTVRVEPEGSSELTMLGESFNAMLDTSQRLVEQVTTAGVEVNSAAAELSASSDELAATTTQQSAAVTQATSTTEELARASAAIADTVDDVASQTAETKDNLEQAEADITLSSERTLALAHKVNDIDALLDLINEIADQTNLLALNAAIEAARAGENGLGFAVVADEVRRLAERSKTSAGEINTIIRAVQGETNATVMAMEKGAKQMQRGLMLLEAVTDANAQVRMTTQQQRSATSQVVETMEQLTDSSRQVSATADQIASAAGNLADLAGNLESSAKTATATNGVNGTSNGVDATSNGHG